MATARAAGINVIWRSNDVVFGRRNQANIIDSAGVTANVDQRQSGDVAATSATAWRVAYRVSASP